MKKKIVVIVVVVLVIVGVIVGVVVAGIVASPYRIYPAQIKEVNVYTAESLPPQYYLRVVAGGPNTCWRPWRYHVTRFGNTIFVKVLTLHDRRVGCGQMVTWVEHTIPLGSCFIPGVTYTVVVNDVTETFVA
jgi:hypothetical protein